MTVLINTTICNDMTELFVTCTYKITPDSKFTTLTYTKILEGVSQHISNLAIPQKISLSFCKSTKRQIWIQHCEQFPQPVFCSRCIRSPNLFSKSRPTLFKMNLIHVFTMCLGQRHLLSSNTVASRTRNRVVTLKFATSLSSAHVTLWTSHLRKCNRPACKINQYYRPTNEFLVKSSG